MVNYEAGPGPGPGARCLFAEWKGQVVLERVATAHDIER
ncbi:uncharacterized protein G2W53_030560 [Senna tora]|uniref:Uncharacterized protein n=1 Tax=Senna tora TaxID=362788 RepID=A0A834WEP8_9FABA|nr:uncharacterized protein G2W53_030560 [Senna tora]